MLFEKNFTTRCDFLIKLRVLLADLPIDVLAVDSTVNDNEVYIPGYEIIRSDRYFKGRSGGGYASMFVRQ